MDSLSPSEGERVSVRGWFEILKAVIPNVGALLATTHSPSNQEEGEELDRFSTLSAKVCSSQPIGWESS